MIYRRLYITVQSLVEHRTESVTTMNHELSVAASSIQLGQSMRSFAVHNSWSYIRCDGQSKALRYGCPQHCRIMSLIRRPIRAWQLARRASVIRDQYNDIKDFRHVYDFPLALCTA